MLHKWSTFSILVGCPLKLRDLCMQVMIYDRVLPILNLPICVNRFKKV